MTLTLPELSLVVLVGVSGSGKSTFARRHFKATEILSSDFCRGLVSDDENNQAATKDAFDVLHYIARKRLAAGKLTVVDATNVQPEARKPLVAIAREFHCLPVAIVLDLPERLAHERNESRPDRNFGPHVIRQQAGQLHRSLRGLEREGFRHVHVLRTLEQVETVRIERQPLWNNLKHEHGPFDLIGDIHGCYDELVELLEALGYAVGRSDGVVESWSAAPQDGEASQNSTPPRLHPPVIPPAGRKLVFLGDLVDRGPKSPQVLRLVMQAVADGVALCVPGNHDMKLLRKLHGKNVQLTHGLAETIAQLSSEPESFHKEVAAFIDDLVSHYVLDDGRLVVAHAGLTESMHGRGSGAVREFCLYGETTGETDEFGLPVRHNWAAEYRGDAMVVYGHTPVPEPEWLNRTLNIDTGCVFGGKLTALRYPEKEWVSVPAKATYAEPARPFLPRSGEREFAAIYPGTESAQSNEATPLTRPSATLSPSNGVRGLSGNVPDQAAVVTSDKPETALRAFPTDAWAERQRGPTTTLSAQQQLDDVLDLADVSGKRIVGTRLHHNITIRAENATAALEVMSRFAVNPKWLIYLPPTMSPSATTQQPGLLEYPAEAFGYYRDGGVTQVICEEKHMGSRAVVIVCRAEAAATKRFGVIGEGFGICYTRTGRRFFDDAATETAFLDRVRTAVDSAGLWEELKTDWLCLDCELMPWSAKAQALVREQYAPVGVAGDAMLKDATALLKQAAGRGQEVGEWLTRTESRQANLADYVAAYGRYCWKVDSVDDLKLAPFHLLASEGAVHSDKPHTWHMETLARLSAAEGSASSPRRLLVATPFRLVDLADPESEAAAIRWWEELTGRGGEGMVVKPLNFIARGKRGLLQPAVKCRGREYLRIIYGPEYTAPENLERLRQRGLNTKRSLALREFALGIEGLERFVRQEALRRVHECAFGVLALESEPVDPRL
jgi:protein phosphatase